MRRVLQTLLICTLVLTIGSWILPLEVEAVLQPDPSPGGDGGGVCTSPTYCEQEACGCSPPPSNCVLQFSCACSSIQCTRSCDYKCAPS